MFLCGGLIGYKFWKDFQMEIIYNFFYALKGKQIGLGDNKITKKTNNVIQMQVVYDF